MLRLCYLGVRNRTLAEVDRERPCNPFRVELFENEDELSDNVFEVRTQREQSEYSFSREFAVFGDWRVGDKRSRHYCVELPPVPLSETVVLVPPSFSNMAGED